MAQGYGYSGYYKPPKPPRVQTRSLASAASGRAGAHDPFGLLTDTTDSARVARNMTPHAKAPTVYHQPDGGDSGPGFGGTDVGLPPGYNAAAAAAGHPPTAPNVYDINTDPALQETIALTGMSDEQARATALKAKQDQLLGYGDPDLVRKLLGDENLAAAAAQNPTSQRAQLGQQRERNLQGLTEGLNSNNLLYSGYRVKQEEQAGQDFQNALAQAAAGVNSSIGGINDQLAGQLGSNEQSRVTARQGARDRALAEMLAGGYSGGDGSSSSGGLGDTTIPPPDLPPDPFGGGGGALSAEDPRVALALAARNRRSYLV